MPPSSADTATLLTRSVHVVEVATKIPWMTRTIAVTSQLSSRVAP